MRPAGYCVVCEVVVLEDRKCDTDLSATLISTNHSHPHTTYALTKPPQVDKAHAALIDATQDLFERYKKSYHGYENRILKIV